MLIRDWSSDVCSSDLDIDAVFLVVTRHAAPESRRCRRGNGDTTLLFLLHPVHGGGAVVDFADFMTDTGVEQDTFGRGGFPCIDLRGDSNIAIARSEDRRAGKVWVRTCITRCSP